MKEVLKRSFCSFCISAVCGAFMNLMIEIVVRMVTGIEDFSPLSPEYVALFPSERIAVEVNILLYGVIGAVFSAMTFIYEKPEIGFVLQNLIYCILTGIFWVPIVVFIWQLNRYPQAFYGTISGFIATYIIMSVVGYKITKKEVEAINLYLGQ